MILLKEGDPRRHVFARMDSRFPTEVGELLQAGVDKICLLKQLRQQHWCWSWCFTCLKASMTSPVPLTSRKEVALTPKGVDSLMKPLAVACWML